MSSGYFVSNGEFNPSSNEHQQDLKLWLSKQPSDKIEEYAWQVLKPFYREKPVDWIQFL